MRHRKLIALSAALATAVLVAAPQGPAGAATAILPVGTQVGLRFVTPVDSSTVSVGTRVNFRVYADVLRGGRIAIRHGAAAKGAVTGVTAPSIFGKSATVIIGGMMATAVDGSQVGLNDIVVSKAMVSKARAGAAGAAAAGAVVLGPVGVLAGAFVRGGHVAVPAGTTVTDTTDTKARVVTR